MSTVRQKKLAPLIIENAIADKPLNKKELVASVGYSQMSAEKKATEILGSKGVQDELKALGFDTETAKLVVGEILLNEKVAPKDRLRAAAEVFKVLGDYAPEKSLNLNLNHTTNDKALGAAEKAYLAQLDGTTGTAESA